MWCPGRNTLRDVAAGDAVEPCKEPQHTSRKRKRARRDEGSPRVFHKARNRANPGGSPAAAQQAPARVSPLPTASFQPLWGEASAAAAGNACKQPAAADGAGHARPQGTISQQPAKCPALADGAESAQRQGTTASKAALKARADQLQQHDLMWCQQWLRCMRVANAARWCQLQQRHPDFTRAALAARQAHTALKESSCCQGHTKYVAVTKTCWCQICLKAEPIPVCLLSSLSLQLQSSLQSCPWPSPGPR